MTTTAFSWQKIYHHKGTAGSLNWSPCGRFICCTSWGGNVAVLDAAGKYHAKEQLASPPDRKSSLPFADWDHQRQTALFILTPERYRLVEVDGKEIESRPGHWANILRARPSHGGYAYLLTEAAHSMVSIVNQAGTQIFTTSEDLQDIRALEWSPNGSRLAIAGRGWISILDPWFRSHNLGVRGFPRAITWLNEKTLAVGCHDTLIRIFTWKSGNDIGGDPTRIDILDTHDSPITSLSYSAASNSLVSLDDSGQIYLWQRKEGSFRIVMSDKFETGELSPELIALLNPVEHKLAISSGRTLYIAQINPAPQETENTANLDTSANATEKLIVKAALQQFLVHSDSIADSWDIWKTDTVPDQISVSLEGKRIAKIIRPLVQEISIALRVIYNNLPVPAKVEFERLAHEPCDGSITSHLKFRVGLIVLLKNEIMADRPQYRNLAIAALIGIAHLGLNEALAATGPESNINEILPRFDEMFRSRVYALQQIIEQHSHELASRPFTNATGHLFKLKDVVEACLQEVSRIVKHTLAHGGGDLQSDAFYTIILKATSRNLAPAVRRFGKILASARDQRVSQ
jgi:WD40 repeat protein